MGCQHHQGRDFASHKDRPTLAGHQPRERCNPQSRAILQRLQHSTRREDVARPRGPRYHLVITTLTIQNKKQEDSIEPSCFLRKYYLINSKEENTIKNVIEKCPKNILDFIGFNLFKDNILVNPTKNQSGIISFLTMDNKALNQNQLNLIYLILYNMISDLYTEKNIPNFLEKEANLDLYKYEKN